MKPAKWKVRKLSGGGWLAHRATCPATDHFCWRGLFGLRPGCRIFDTWRPAFDHALTGARYEQMMDYMDSAPLYSAKLQ